MIQIQVNNQPPANFTDFLVGAGQAAFSLKIVTAPVNAPIQWTITPLGAHSGTVTPNVGTTKQFTFTPNVAAARMGLTTGSRTANDPVGYRIRVVLFQSTSPRHQVANLGLFHKVMTPQAAPPALSAPAEEVTVEFNQDEQSVLRQEYVDFGGQPSARASLSSHNGAYNCGNYSHVVNLADMQQKFNNTLSSYRGTTIQIPAPPAPAGGPPGLPAAPALVNVTIPQTAGVSITCAYRNPRRNVAAGSHFPITSRHVFGCGLDMVPTTPVTVAVNKQVVTLELHRDLYPALHSSAATQGTAVAEHGATQVQVGDATEDHVHLEW